MYRLVDWTMLVMFTGLFIVVAAFAATDPAEAVSSIGVPRLHAPGDSDGRRRAPLEPGEQRAGRAAVPPNFSGPLADRAGSLIISTASTYAGNLTVVGSIANLIVVENAPRRKINLIFVEYLRVGVPVTIFTS